MAPAFIEFKIPVRRLWSLNTGNPSYTGYRAQGPVRYGVDAAAVYRLGSSIYRRVQGVPRGAYQGALGCPTGPYRALPGQKRPSYLVNY